MQIPRDWDAEVSFQNGVYKGTAILCRAVLDTAATTFGATKGTLAKKLDDLKAKGVIEGKMYDWAVHVLKDLGNDAAHDATKEITKADAKDALEFTKVILDYLYVSERAFQRFKARRSAAKAKAASKPVKSKAGTAKKSNASSTT